MKFPLRIYCIKITNRIRIRVLAYKHFDPKHTKMYNYNFITIYIFRYKILLFSKYKYYMYKYVLYWIENVCPKHICLRLTCPAVSECTNNLFCMNCLLKCMQIVSRCCHNKKTFIMSYYYYYYI